MNVKPKFVYYDIRRKQSVCLIMYTHENDVDTQVLEVSMLDNGEPIELSVDYTYTAAIVNRETKALINDNISCELNDSGNVLIPIDNFHTLGAQDLLIELTITDSAGDQVLVTPFPLWIHVNPSILDDAQVTPESEGTVPELLEEAKEALENAGDYENLENKPQINGHELVGNKTGDDLGLQGKLTAGENVTINENGEISATGGTDDYNELKNLPVMIYDGKAYVIKEIGLGTGLKLYKSSSPFFSIAIRSIDGRHVNVTNLPFSALDDSVAYSILKRVNLENGQSVDTAPPNSIAWVGGNPGTPTNTGNGWLITIGDSVTKENGNLYQIFFPVWGYYPVVRRRGRYVNSVSSVSGVVPRYDYWYGFSEKIDSSVVNQNGTITFTMSDGSTVTTTGQSVIGPQGDDYVLTPQDKSDIAAIVLSELPTTQGVQYGNTSD